MEDFQLIHMSLTGEIKASIYSIFCKCLPHLKQNRLCGIVREGNLDFKLPTLMRDSGPFSLRLRPRWLPLPDLHLTEKWGLGIVYWSIRLKDLRTVPTIVTAHIFCACQGSRARRERNAQHAGHADWFCLL